MQRLRRLYTLAEEGAIPWSAFSLASLVLSSPRATPISFVSSALPISERRVRDLVAILEVHGVILRETRGRRAFLVPCEAGETQEREERPARQTVERVKVVAPGPWASYLQWRNRKDAIHATVKAEHAPRLRLLFERHSPEELSPQAWARITGLGVKNPLAFIASCMIGEDGELEQEARPVEARPAPRETTRQESSAPRHVATTEDREQSTEVFAQLRRRLHGTGTPDTTTN